MQDGQLITFAKWKPDVTPINTQASPIVSNVVPRADGYGPFPSFVTLTQNLPGPCRGGIFARNNDGSVTVFAATATNLYQLNNTTFAWVNVSKAGGPYSSVPSTDNWQFVQFQNIVFAVQANTVMQAFTLTISSAFADQAGSPPQASHIAIINQFVLLTGIVGFPYRIAWCDIFNPTVWTPGVGQAGELDLTDGGIVHDIRGGDQYGIVFQDQSIRSLYYAPGSVTIFNVLRISTSDGIIGQYSSVTAGDRVFFYSPQGFKKIEAGGYPQPIGKEILDRTFIADLDQSNLQLFIGATDPASTRVYWMYKSQSGAMGLADKILVYDWALDSWSPVINQALEFLMYLTKPGLTLEGLDSIIVPSIINISAAATGAGGVVRLTLSGLTAGTPPSNTNLNIENTVEIYNATGGVPAGNFRFNIIDSTHIDLIGTTFTVTGTGSIGGSLDQLGFSLDSFGAAPIPQFSAFNSGNALGTFSGPNLEAIAETPMQDLGERVFIVWLRPMTDAAGCFGSLGTLDTAQQTPVVYTGELQVNAQGTIPQRVETRYARARLRVPAGTTWTYMMGVKSPDVQPGQGDR
jgi:hypothetical protein